MAQYTAPTAWTSVLTTALDSLADAAASAASATQDNSTTRYGIADVSLILGSVNPTSGGAHVEIHLCPRLGDGTSFADANASTIVGTVAVDTGSSTKEGALLAVQIPPGHFQWRARNRMGVTSASSGNTIAVRYYDLISG